MQLRALIIRSLTAGLCTLAAIGGASAHAQSNEQPFPLGKLPAAQAPGAALMNNLHERMKQIQATPDPALRQKRMDEFLRVLQKGMTEMSKQPVAGR